MKLPKFSKLVEQFWKHPQVLAVLNWTKNNSLPGLSSIPIYDVFVFIYYEIRKDKLITRANSIAYSFFIALFPTIIAIFTLIPYILPYVMHDKLLSFLPDGNVDFNQTLILQLKEVLPDNHEENIIEFIEGVATQPRFGLLSFGFILAIFFASNGIMSLMKGFEKSHKTTFVQRNAFHKRFIAIQLTFLLGFLVIASVLLVILGDQLLWLVSDILNTERFDTIAVIGLRWIVLISLFYFGISFIYRQAVPTIRKFTLFSTGATVATIFSILSTLIFSIYVDNFGNYNKLYGSIGTIIVVMLWIQINVLILLLGFELNASIEVNKDLKAIRIKEEEANLNE